MTQQAKSLDVRIVKQVHLNYLLFLPEGYEDDPDKDWPLVFFLHGAGERGDDLEQLKIHGIPKVVEARPDMPFVAVSPQCPAEEWWPAKVEELTTLLDHILARYRVDERRVYLTGISMGGYGSWSLAVAQPDRFAALVPICGGLMGPPVLVRRLADVPIWVFHGEKDPVVDIEESQRLVDELEEAGGNVRFTAYPDAEHDSWTRTYENEELYEWMLAQRRE